MSSSSLSPLVLKASREPKESTGLVSSCSTTTTTTATTTKSTRTSSTSRGKKLKKQKKLSKSVGAGADDQVYWDPPQQSQVVRSVDQLRLGSPTNKGPTGALTETRESSEAAAAHPAHPPLRTPSRMDQPGAVASVISETRRSNPAEPGLRAPAEGHHDHVSEDLRKRKRTNSTTTTTTTDQDLSSSPSSRPTSRSHHHTPPSKNTPIPCQWNLRAAGHLMNKFTALKNTIRDPKLLIPKPMKTSSNSKKSTKRSSLSHRTSHRHQTASSSSKPKPTRPS